MIELKVPSAGESVVEVQVGRWYKKVGDRVERDESLVELETDKASMDLPSPSAGVIKEITRQQGDMVEVGDVIGLLEEGDAPEEDSNEHDDKSTSKYEAERKQNDDAEPRIMPAAQRLIEENDLSTSNIQASGPGGRLLKEDVLDHLNGGSSTETKADEKEAAKSETLQGEKNTQPVRRPGDSELTELEESVPMTLIRRRIAERLVEAQQTAALLTTFNEVDMTEVMELRKEHKDAFIDRYGVKLGFMSFFVKAVVDALKQFPELNAEIRERNIVYRNYYNVGIAIGGGKGLVVPILFRADRMSFADIEKGINDYAQKVRDGKITPDDLVGGTFTITNGGVYGSLLSTPIVNPPQSGVLGMHIIQDRPVALEGKVVIRPMMYIALTYDHRIVDGEQAVKFLKRIKEDIEDPTRMLMEV